MKSLKPALLACLALLIVAPPALAGPAGPATASAPAAHTQFARLGGRGFGGRGFGTRGRSRFGSRRGTGIFRRIVRAIAIGYLLHLLFTTPGGLIVLLLMVLAVFALMSRLRRRSSFRY